MPKEGKRSPFPRPSLPQAGESLGDLAMDLFFDRFLIFLIMGMTFAAVAGGVDWLSVWLGKRVSPWFWTNFAAILCALAVWRYVRIKPQLEQIWLGRRGGREVPASSIGQLQVRPCVIVVPRCCFCRSLSLTDAFCCVRVWQTGQM